VSLATGRSAWGQGAAAFGTTQSMVQRINRAKKQRRRAAYEMLTAPYLQNSADEQWE
jgi:hypothetical protein